MISKCTFRAFLNNHTRFYVAFLDKISAMRKNFEVCTFSNFSFNIHPPLT